MNHKYERMGKLFSLLLILALITGAFIYIKKDQTSKYDDPGYKSYLENVKYCSKFAGGNKGSDQNPEVYKAWQENQIIGC